LLGALWLRGGGFAILTGVGDNVWDKVNYQLRLLSVSAETFTLKGNLLDRSAISLIGHGFAVARVPLLPSYRRTLGPT
jgi:hypothetical protein